jgi:hypothetical protein
VKEHFASGKNGKLAVIIGKISSLEGGLRWVIKTCKLVSLKNFNRIKSAIQILY